MSNIIFCLIFIQVGIFFTAGALLAITFAMYLKNRSGYKETAPVLARRIRARRTVRLAS